MRRHVAGVEKAVGVGAIHIVESLPVGEDQTGERLYRWLTSPAGPEAYPISLHFWREPTKAGILQRLGSIADHVRETGRSPTLHLEAHGCPEGIGTAGGELITWAELKGPLTMINITCRLNLLVLVQACDGEGLLDAVQPTDRAPL